MNSAFDKRHSRSVHHVKLINYLPGETRIHWSKALRYWPILISPKISKLWLLSISSCSSFYHNSLNAINKQ